MFGSCIDIDPVAADMAFIQLSLLGIAAEVVTGNTLTMQYRRVRYTPVYYLNAFEKRLADLRRFRAMRTFARNTGGRVITERAGDHLPDCAKGRAPASPENRAALTRRPYFLSAFSLFAAPCLPAFSSSFCCDVSFNP
uniref:Uncharacterized protein n=1 Tax=Klebsiella pneumoniae TaxID=573 RepID=A0A2P1BPY2_KLEPN|nr:hypothetical protein [Klebsiella pneumoniae]